MTVFVQVGAVSAGGSSRIPSWAAGAVTDTGSGGGQLAAGVAVLAVGYMLWCAAYPWKGCPRCSGKSTAGDRRGNYRVRRDCWRCHGSRYPRIGTRLLMLFGFTPRS